MTDYLQLLFYLLGSGLLVAATFQSVRVWRQGFAHRGWILLVLLCLAAFFLGMALLLRGLAQERCPVGTLSEVMVFFAWLVSIVQIGGTLLLRTGALSAAVVPVLTVVVLLAGPGWIHPTGRAIIPTGIRNLHITVTLLSYAFFAFGAACASLYLVQARNLKSRLLLALRAGLPSLERLERLCSFSVQIGWLLLTSGVILGGLWALSGEETISPFDPKVIWSIIFWIGYSIAMLMHARKNFYDRSGLKLIVGLFFALTLSFWVVSWISPTH